MDGQNGPAAVTAGLLWAVATWLDPGLLGASLALVLALALISARFSPCELPLRGMAFAAVLGALAHLFGGGTFSAEIQPAISAALRLAALFAEGRFIYLLVGPSRLAAGVGWLARPMRLLGVREGEMELMALVVLRLLPEARRILRRVLLGRRYLGLRMSPREILRAMLAWLGGVIETAGAIGETLVLRGFGRSRVRTEAISWQGLLTLSWLPGATLLFGMTGYVR